MGWAALEGYLRGKHDRPAVIYETADPGKFPDDVHGAAIGVVPELPPGMKEQAGLPERIYSIGAEPEKTPAGLKLSAAQVSETKEKIRGIYNR